MHKNVHDIWLGAEKKKNNIKTNNISSSYDS